MDLYAVAPLAGAWIETGNGYPKSKPKNVAPLAGAWIETWKIRDDRFPARVAPLAGAWIETVIPMCQ